MRLRVVSARNEISNLNPNEKTVHLAFRASNVDFLNLMQRCPRLRMIQVPPSYRKTMSNAIQVFLDMQGIELLEGGQHGRGGKPDSEKGQARSRADQVHSPDKDHRLILAQPDLRSGFAFYFWERFISSEYMIYFCELRCTGSGRLICRFDGCHIRC